MSELAVTLMRVGYLLLLWLFVLAAIGVLRRDLFTATRVTTRGRGRRPARHDTPTQRPDTPTPARSMPTRLLVTSGSLTGTSLPLGRSAVVIGRAQSCTLVLDDDYASSRHARIYPDGDRWMVEDLGSTNGTVVGSQQITAPTPLAVGSQVRIGRTTLELRR